MADRIPYEVVEDGRGVRVIRGDDLIGWTWETRHAESFARELNALQDLERSAYERGLREGREAERADAVAWLRGPAIDLANPAMRDCMEELCGMVAPPIERAEHVPTPQGDDVALVVRHECESNDSNKAPKPCATCGGPFGPPMSMDEHGDPVVDTCPDCAGESGGGR